MRKPDKTICVTDCPVSDPTDRTVTSFEIFGSLSALRGLTIAVSREVELPAILARLQAMWRSELERLGQETPPCTEKGLGPNIP